MTGEPGVSIARPASHVAELIMNRPEALNALSTQQARLLIDACAELADDPQLSVVIITSASDRAFCVGADLKERAGFDDDDLRAQRPVFVAAFGGLLDLAVPTIAAVDGFALGGGCELALCCDVIVASEKASSRTARGRPRADPRWWRHPAAAAPGGAESRRGV